MRDDREDAQTRVPGSLAWWCAAAAAEAVAEVDPTKPSDVVFAAVYDALVGNDPGAAEEVPRPEWLGGDAADVPDPVTKLLLAVDRLHFSARATWGGGEEKWPMGISISLGDVLAAADRLQVDLPGICGLRDSIVRLRRLLARAERQGEEAQVKAPHVHLVEREVARLRHERDEALLARANLEIEVARLRACCTEPPCGRCLVCAVRRGGDVAQALYEARVSIRRLLVTYRRFFQANWYESTARECGLSIDSLGNVVEPSTPDLRL